MTTTGDWDRQVRRTFQEIAQHTDVREVQVGEFSLLVYPQVFAPDYFNDSLWFAEEIAQLAKGKRLLEAGTGTGIISLAAALRGANVTATDMNPYAVANAQANFKRHGVSANLLLTDVFDGIRSGERYDVIFWNHPFNRGEDPEEDLLLRAGYDFRYRGLQKYLSQGPSLLAEEGRLLLGTGKFPGVDEINKISLERGLEMHLLESHPVEMAPGRVPDNEYRLYELT